MPELSIIIPTFNAIKTIEETLNSIRTQTFQDFELIVFDNHSNDGTLEILRNESRIDTLIVENDKGIYDAMNKATRVATGKWCYYIGSDDILFDNQTLEKVFELDNSHIDFMYGNVLLKNKQVIYDGLFDTSKLSMKNICHQALFIRRKVLIEKGLFSLKYKAYADWHMNISCFCDPELKVKYTPQTIAVYNEGGFSAGFYDIAFHKDKYQLIQEHLNITLSSAQKYSYCYEYALVLKRRKKLVKSFSFLLKSILFVPNRIQRLRKYVKF